MFEQYLIWIGNGREIEASILVEEFLPVAQELVNLFIGDFRIKLTKPLYEQRKRVLLRHETTLN